MMRRMILFLMISAALLALNCSDPASSDRKYIVKTLIEEEYWPEGQYSIFWDGTDDENNLLAPGTYYVRLWSRNFTHQIEMTAESGRFSEYNDDGTYSMITETLITLLYQNKPDPFIISEGTCIPFDLAEPARIQLTIRNHE